MIKGLTTGFSKTLIIEGTGFKAELVGKKLKMALGFSHPVHYVLPEGVTAKVEGSTTIVLESANKEVLGQAAADIRAFRPPEPYQGKGVKYEEEHIRRKAGKAAAGAK